MSLVIRPHTATVYSTSVEPDADGILGQPEFAGTTTVLGQLTPLDPSKTFDEAGEIVAMPHKFMFNLADIANFQDGTKFTVGGRTLFVVGAPKRWNVGDICDHGSVICTEVVRG